MINILDKRNCCGCNACAQICPKKCIQMNEDQEGFLYPSVNKEICINCGLCEKTCPILFPFPAYTQQPISYACVNTNESIRAQSSSGGLFSLLAEKIIIQGGVVFGARFDSDWNVLHDYTETLEGIEIFRGSKYVQSVIGNSYSLAKDFLQKGRLVLFSGTPCQIAGLNHFLNKKNYENLCTIDFVCHSIPSPKIWRMYLTEIHSPAKTKCHSSKITDVTFRSKDKGWKNYGIKINAVYLSKKHVIDSGSQKENTFMRGFLEDLYSRPACSLCPAREYRSGSDITIADFWKIEKYHPEFDDDKGVSLAILLTEKGVSLFHSLAMKTLKVPYEEVEDHGVHASILKSSPIHPYRNIFFKMIGKNTPLISAIEKNLRNGERRRRIMTAIKIIIKYILTNLGLKSYLVLWKKK